MDITIVEDLFSKDECNYILTFVEKFENSGIKTKNQILHNDYRTSQDCLVPNPILQDYLLSKLSLFELNYMRTPCFIKYETGSKFKLHRDNTDGYEFRYKSLVIQLSDSSDYTGGELIIKRTIIPKSLGTVVLFNSSLLHEVTELTSGVRYSLCTFLTKEDFKQKLL